jgi:uncharacterized OsmC-like protein
MTAATTTIVRDAVDTATLFCTLDVMNRVPHTARLAFRVHNRWRAGMEDRSTIEDYFGVDEMHTSDSTAQEAGETPAECIVHALASTLTAGVVQIAAAHGVALAEVTSTVEGDISLDGVLGLDPNVRNGFERLHVRFAVKGAATAQQLQQVVEESQAGPAVFEVVTGGVAVAVVVDPS